MPIVERLGNAQGEHQRYLSVLNGADEVASDLIVTFKRLDSRDEIWSGLQASPKTSIVAGQKIEIPNRSSAIARTR
ncbi:MAG: hypothetical protein LBJ64_03065 [Deltaproteobacteria bacterium]|jgi:hypothetical protein|nr:hypothetical protein [Deltaproteobacteria bacterium]